MRDRMEINNIEEVRATKNEDGEFTNIDMKHVVNIPNKDKETKEIKKSEPRSNLKKILLDHFVLVAAIILITIVLIGLIILSVVLTRSHSQDNIENLVERVLNIKSVYTYESQIISLIIILSICF